MKLTKGYTLIEVIIVIVLIVAMSVMFMNTFPGVQRRARDTQRRSDLKQFDEALRVYSSKNGGFYPGRSGGTGVPASNFGSSPPTLCGDLGETSCPYDPNDNSLNCKTGVCRYYYQSNNCNDGSSCATSYTLRGRLENTDGFWVICSTGTTGIAPESASFSSCPI